MSGRKININMDAAVKEMIYQMNFKLDKIEEPLKKYKESVLMAREPTENVACHIQSTIQYTKLKNSKDSREKANQFKLALSEYEIGNNNVVQEICQNLLKLKPGDMNVLILLSAAFCKLGQYDKSIESLKNVPQEYRKCVEVLNNLGSNYYLKGQMIEARDYYYDAICREPRYVDCWMSYIKALVKTDDQKNAFKLLEMIIGLKKPDLGKTRSLYRQFILKFNRADDALKQFKLALQNPKYTSSWIYMGNYYYSKTNQIDTAMKCYIRALEIDNSLIAPKINLGLIYLRIDEFCKAISILLAAHRLCSCDSSIIRIVGLIYWTQRNIPLAIQAYKLFLAHNPDHLDANYDLGVLYYAWHKSSVDAEPYFNKCIELDSENDIYYKNLAMVYQSQSKISLAAKTCELLGDLYYKRNDGKNARTAYYYYALLAPQNSNGHWKLGLAFSMMGHYSHAYLRFIEALEMKCLYSTHITEADSALMVSYLECQQNICKFTQLGDHYLKFLKTFIKNQLRRNITPDLSPLQSLYFNLPSIVIKLIVTLHANEFLRSCVEERQYEYNETLSSDNRIRVGYLYSNSSSHSTTTLVRAIRHLHNKNKVEVFCYTWTPMDDRVTKPTGSSVSDDGIIDISKLSSIDAADKINADNLNILVGVNGFPKDAQDKILALRPAPIQVKILGFSGTSGAPYIDYIITDKICSPPGSNIFYTEKLAYLNRTVFFGNHKMLYNDISPGNTLDINSAALECEDADVDVTCDSDGESNINTSLVDVETHPDDTQKYVTRQDYQLPEDSVVYCYLGKITKINEHALILWLTILRNVPNSVLWLIRFPGGSEFNLNDFFEKHDIDPARIIFSDDECKADHLKRIQLADIFLDTTLYCGNASCVDALWAGIPIITMIGGKFSTCMTASQLTAMNCAQTIANDESDYIQKAIELGTNQSLLEETKSKIWQAKHTSELFDSKSYAEELESAYTYMWDEFIENA